MAGDRKILRQDRKVPAAQSCAVSFDLKHIRRIKSAMSKVARELPNNPKLGPVWTRLEKMYDDAVAVQVEETETQRKARVWLLNQKDISSNSFAMSANGSPSP